MTLLSFRDKYVVTSAVAASTVGTARVDDPYAQQTFNLSKSQTVLIIYQANNVHGASMYLTGMINCISIDASDHEEMADSPSFTSRCCRNVCFWIGTLAAGSHTVKGRFRAWSVGQTVTISNRILLIYIFDGDEFGFLESTTVKNTTLTTFVDDEPPAGLTVSPSADCKALFLYAAANLGVVESLNGKKIAMNIAGTDYSQAEKRPVADVAYSDSIFTCYANSLVAGSVTLKGRVASHVSGQNVMVNLRHLGILLLADDTLLNIIVSDIQVQTPSAALVDDPQATINRTITIPRELLVIAMGTKRHGVSSNYFGECYGIWRGSDRTNSRGSAATTGANSAATCWAETLAAGSYTVKGRFATNLLPNIAKISSRRVIALWLVPPPPVPAKPLINKPLVNPILINAPCVR